MEPWTLSGSKYSWLHSPPLLIDHSVCAGTVKYDIGQIVFGVVVAGKTQRDIDRISNQAAIPSNSCIYWSRHGSITFICVCLSVCLFNQNGWKYNHQTCHRASRGKDRRVTVMYRYTLKLTYLHLSTLTPHWSSDNRLCLSLPAMCEVPRSCPIVGSCAFIPKITVIVIYSLEQCRA